MPLLSRYSSLAVTERPKTLKTQKREINEPARAFIISCNWETISIIPCSFTVLYKSNVHMKTSGSSNMSSLMAMHHVIVKWNSLNLYQILRGSLFIFINVRKQYGALSSPEVLVAFRRVENSCVLLGLVKEHAMVNFLPSRSFTSLHHQIAFDGGLQILLVIVLCAHYVSNPMNEPS